MPPYRTTSYRYPFERLILAGTILLVIAILTISATITFSLAFFLILLILGFSYLANRSQHASLIHRSYQINSRSAPELVNLEKTCQARIQPSRNCSRVMRLGTK